MRNFQKAAVVVAMLGSVGMLGAGVGHADGKLKIDNKQSTRCSADQTTNQGGLVNIGELAVQVAALNGISEQEAQTGGTANCPATLALGK